MWVGRVDVSGRRVRCEWQESEVWVGQVSRVGQSR